MDTGVLECMAESLDFRGPDASSTWRRDSAGLAHTLLRVTDESMGEAQPLTLDGHRWIVADARIDAREELLGKLVSRGRPVVKSATDAELILHAYHAWGAGCTGHLLGDFSFAIVDPGQRRLFCARDHLGVRPFFYAVVKDQLIWSNTLDTMRLHPDISDEVNDTAIADFLLFGFNRDPATTTFRDIQRLPPAHQLLWTGQGLQVTRYWTFSLPEERRLKRVEDYLERFQGLFGDAVADRVRTDRIGISMSGGLDSPAVAVEVARHLRENRPEGRVWAQTFVFDRIIPDEERHYAGLVSAALGIEHDVLAVDRYECRDGYWDSPDAHGPEPQVRSFCLAYEEGDKRAAARTRVMMSGEGADEGLRGPRDYFLALTREGRWGRWGLDVCRHIRAHRRLPPHRVRATLRRIRRGPQPPSEGIFPCWLNPDLSHRLGLEERWHDYWRREDRLAHSRRPGLFYVFESAHLPLYFEGHDAGTSGTPIEYGFPFFDLRVLRFLLSVPTVPWKYGKHLLRAAMKGALPDPILHRPKAPLAGDPALAAGGRFPIEWRECMKRTPELERYISPGIDQQNRDADPASDDSKAFELASWWYHRRQLNR